MCDKQPWSQYEDDSLIAAITEVGENFKWRDIEIILKEKYGIKSRTSKQCRERWTNNLDPSCRKREWTVEEDAIIFTYQQKFGNNWSKISRFLVGRSDNTIKNHFYATIRRKLRRYNKLNTEKIKKSLKEIVNDKNLLKLLMSVPEKEKKRELINEIRRSNRLSLKANSALSSEDDNCLNGPEFDLGSLSNLLQLSNINYSTTINDFCSVKQSKPIDSTFRLPSFTLNTSFQFHKIDD